MKIETGVLIIKGLAVTLIGVFTPWSSSLAQWANSGEWPEKIVWIGVILPASIIGGMSALSAFLSGAFKTYTDKRNGDTQFLSKPPTQ